MNKLKQSVIPKIQNWFKSKKKWIILFIGIIILPPILFNIIIQINIPFISIANDSDWIGFFGSFSGSIIGGALTLIGVRLTITSQENREFLNDVPKKLRRIDSILLQINQLLGDMEVKTNEEKVNSIQFNEVCIMNKIELILEEASETNGETYNYVNSIKTSIDIFYEQNKNSIELDNWNQQIIVKGKYIEFIKSLMNLHEEVNILIDLIKKHRKQLSNKYFKLINK